MTSKLLVNPERARDGEVVAGLRLDNSPRRVDGAHPFVDFIAGLVG